MIRGIMIVMSAGVLSACAHTTQDLSIDGTQWRAAQRVKTQRVEVGVTTPPRQARLISIDSDSVQQAFNDYQKTGKAPIIDGKGFIQFPFGESEPVIYCQPLRTCNITLQVGEKITGVLAGDTARWQFTQALSGEGDTLRPHVIFKPMDYDISTNAIITTNRRTYHVALLSKEDAYVRQVTFYYPQDIQKEMEALNQTVHQQHSQAEQAVIAELAKLSIDELSFDYELKTKTRRKSISWLPQRVFNDGTRVFIQMPPKVKQMDAPVLFTLSQDGQQALANYRVQGDYYIVDTLFSQAVLVAGVGRNQQHVSIHYRG